MMPVIQMPANDANQLPTIYFGGSRNPPGGGSGGGGSRPGGKPGKPTPKKPTGGKTSKKRK